ncbi:MAG: hypothetical protein PVF49_06695, partial [Anaerolineales bacterium]
GPIRATQQAEEEATAEVENATATAVAVQDAHRTSVALASTIVVETEQARATANAGEMLADLQAMAEAGYLESTAGHYESLPDYYQARAMINYFGYEWLYMDPTNFVLRGHVLARMDGESGNAFSSGCGIIFRVTEHTYYVAIQAMDGTVYFYKKRANSNVLPVLGRKYVGQIGFPEAEYDFTLIVDGPSFHWFINGEHIAQFYDGSYEHGDIGYAMLSGTNTGFGTSCSITDVEIWILE